MIPYGVHRGCGGFVVESETKLYFYCSTHEDCNPEKCPSASRIPALYCSVCKEEIFGDAQIITHDEERGI